MVLDSSLCLPVSNWLLFIFEVTMWNKTKVSFVHQSVVIKVSSREEDPRGDPWGLLASQPSLVGKAPSQWETKSQNTWLNSIPEKWSPTTCIHVCSCIHTSGYIKRNETEQGNLCICVWILKWMITGCGWRKNSVSWYWTGNYSKTYCWAWIPFKCLQKSAFLPSRHRVGTSHARCKGLFFFLLVSI